MPCVDVHDAADLSALEEELRNSGRLQHDQPSKDAVGGIKVNNRELRDVSTDCLNALRTSNQPRYLFVRSGTMVQVATDEDGRSSILPVAESFLRGSLTRCADFYRTLAASNSFLNKPTNPPLDVVRDILSRPQDEWGFPSLVAVTESPILRADGSILLEPGYDSVLRVVYVPAPGLRIPTIPAHPTRDDIRAAVVLIDDGIGQFPFVDDSSRANAFATLLTPLIRRSVEGHVPVSLIDAPQAGTGKTLLAEVIANIHTGSNAAMKPAPGHDDEEWRKTLTAVLQAGHPLTIFDNVDSVLKAPSLALAVTASHWTDRILGKSQTITLPQQTTFVVTGNNVMLGGDLPRRCFWTRLDAATSRPWQRRNFRHPDLKAWVRNNRGDLLCALLTLARAWYVAGSPLAEVPILGSFENWCRTIGGILAYAGIKGFLGNLNLLYDQADPSQQQWQAFLGALQSTFGASCFRANELIERMRTDGGLRESLPDELADDDASGSFQKRIGRAFLRNLGRRFGENGIRIEKAGMTSGVTKWMVKVG